MATMKTVCVTGAGGFIASWIVLKLLQKGYKVHGTVRDPDNVEKYKHLKNLEGANDGLTLFRADVLDHDSLAAAIHGCDAVFHTACPVAFNYGSLEDVLRPAVVGTQNVLKLCSKEKIKRVIMTSSAATIIYNRNQPAVLDESCWSDPEYCRENKFWYQLAKTESEKLAWELAKQHNLDLVVLCPTLVCGPLLQPSLNFSSEYLKKLKDGAYPGRFVPSIDVRDVAEAHIAALENEAAAGRYLLVHGFVSQEDIVDVVKRKLPHLCSLEKAGGAQVVSNVAFPKQVLKFSSDKAKELIQKFIPFDEMLVDTFSSLQEKGLL